MVSTFFAAAFVFGAIIGSFLNVVIFRHGTGKNLNGRSMCFNCGKTLRWFELVPILSFLVQRGRCRDCGAKISWQYPAVEALTGFVFSLVILQNADLLSLAYFLSVWCFLILIFVYDLKHKIIPDSFVYSFIALGLARVLLAPHGPFWVWTELLAGPLLFLPFFLLWYFSGGRWMGYADGKLALGIGWFLGLLPALNAIILAFWIGAVVAVGFLLLKKLPGFGSLPVSLKTLTIKSEIPFAPFLVIGTALVFFTAINVLPPI